MLILLCGFHEKEEEFLLKRIAIEASRMNLNMVTGSEDGMTEITVSRTEDAAEQEYDIVIMRDIHCVYSVPDRMKIDGKAVFAVRYDMPPVRDSSEKSSRAEAYARLCALTEYVSWVDVREYGPKDGGGTDFSEDFPAEVLEKLAETADLQIDNFMTIHYNQNMYGVG